VGLGRGFTGNCLITLVPTRQQLSTENSYIKAAERLAAEVASLVREAALDTARDNWLGNAIGYPLSVCPHR
jgi:hypothetical protein